MKTLFIALFLLLAGFQNVPVAVQSGTVDSIQSMQTDPNYGLKLNNGEKWKVDTNMMAHIRTMEKEIQAFSATSGSDYKNLAKKLKNGLNLLTSQCTMKGSAHDELHKWLLPYMDLVQALDKSKNPSERAGTLSQLQSSMRVFNRYFE